MKLQIEGRPGQVTLLIPLAGKRVLWDLTPEEARHVAEHMRSAADVADRLVDPELEALAEEFLGPKP